MLGFGVLFLALGILTIWLLPYETVVSVEGRHLTYELKFLGLFTVESISLPATEIAGISIELVTGISRSYEVRIDAPPQPWRLWLPSADGDTK